MFTSTLRSATVVATALLLSACSDSVAPPGEADAWMGTYDLATVDGHVLPALWELGFGTSITSGTLVLDADSRYELNLRFQSGTQSTGSTYRGPLEVASTTRLVLISNDACQLPNAPSNCEERWNGVLSANELSLDFGGNGQFPGRAMRFTRRVPA